MRVMVLVQANVDSERGAYAEHAEEFAEMGRFNEELVNAGVMEAGEGLAPSSEGKRISFEPDGSATVFDGPFAEAREVVGGFWIWRVNSMDEAVEWLRKAPFRQAVVEIRRIHDESDFEGLIPDDVIAQEGALRKRLSEG